MNTKQARKSSARRRTLGQPVQINDPELELGQKLFGQLVHNHDEQVEDTILHVLKQIIYKDLPENLQMSKIIQKGTFTGKKLISKIENDFVPEVVDALGMWFDQNLLFRKQMGKYNSKMQNQKLINMKKAQTLLTEINEMKNLVRQTSIQIESKKYQDEINSYEPFGRLQKQNKKIDMQINSYNLLDTSILQELESRDNNLNNKLLERMSKLKF